MTFTWENKQIWGVEAEYKMCTIVVYMCLKAKRKYIHILAMITSRANSELWHDVHFACFLATVLSPAWISAYDSS